MGIILLLFLVSGIVAGTIGVAQNRKGLDRWLCIKAPWRFRLWWCTLWVREEEFHPSLDSDMDALGRKINWERKKLIFVTNFRFAFKCTRSESEKKNIAKRLSELTKRLEKEYFDSIDARRDIVRKRNPENRLHQSPS